MNLDDPGDSDVFVSMMNTYAEDPAGGGAPLPPEVVSRLVTDLPRRPAVHCLAGFLDETPAALANCIEGYSTFRAAPLLNIHDFVVLPSFRGLGLSQALLTDVEVLGRTLGCCKLTLEVLSGNRAACGSYLKFGFARYELDPTLGGAEFWQKPLVSPKA